jgi:Skp family chaperone for outer membrane proteins
MKKSSFLMMGGVAAVSIALALPIQAQQKIGTIDMQRVFTGYYKTRDAETKLQEAQKAYKDELDQRMDIYKKNLDTINKFNEEINRPELSGASKDQKAQERDSKIAETKGLEKEITDFRSAREKELQEQMNRMRQGIVEEIMKVVNEQVKAANYDLVFDKSGQSLNSGVPVLIFARENMDFSESVITKLNANRPPVTASPAAAQGQKPQLTQPEKSGPAITTKPGGFPSPNRKP